ncbi:uncharacterized protein LOC126821248 [Patella vulgata]|uniref:uncharacterized protein LOC126821248 n=1 Tax=Patella vulgata TaxID=6465 RepID=UPI0021802D80|nr:uncharacterized protein LOC126821248 [Patella vulgata]
MAIYMPPLSRKKKVPDHFHPDSFRVISREAEENHEHFPSSCFHGLGRRPWSQSNILPNILGRETRVLPHVMPDYRANKPQPSTCNFLTHNVRLLNEPVCTVTTQKTLSEQPYWWCADKPEECNNKPSYSLDTLYRNDFQNLSEQRLHLSSRHSSNPNKDPAYGIIPINQLGGRKHKHRLYAEKMSYEHEYNSRKDPNYPIRSRRQGNFVWNEMKPDKLKEFIDYHQSLNEYQDPQKSNYPSSVLTPLRQNSSPVTEVPELLPSGMQGKPQQIEYDINGADDCTRQVEINDENISNNCLTSQPQFSTDLPQKENSQIDLETSTD